MSDTTFFVIFGVTWVAAMAYALSAFRLLMRVRHLRAEGRGGEAPDPMANPLDVFGYLAWLMTGRYAELNDEVATRWAGIARVLFVLALPLMLTVFVLAFTQAGLLS